MVGNASGYAIGAKAGPAIFQRENSRLFKKKYVDKTHEFFEKYGNRAIVLARFVPIVRTFITVMAGVGDMGFRRFMVYSAIGGAVWASGVTVLGYYLGQVVVRAQQHRGDAARDRADLGGPDRHRVPPGPGRGQGRRPQALTQNAETSPARSRRDRARTTAAWPCRRSEIPTSRASTGPSTGSGRTGASMRHAHREVVRVHDDLHHPGDQEVLEGQRPVPPRHRDRRRQLRCGERQPQVVDRPLQVLQHPVVADAGGLLGALADRPVGVRVDVVADPGHPVVVLEQVDRARAG